MSSSGVLLRALLGVLGAIGGSLVLALPASALEQKLTAADGATADQLGWQVAIDGDTIVAGSPRNDGAKGAAYVFQRSGDAWADAVKLTAADGAAMDEFGAAVAIDGDTIVVGAPRNGGKGAVYVFGRSGDGWIEQAKLTATDGAASDNLGISVAIDGDTIVAGARDDDDGASTSEGSAYTFSRTGVTPRTETAKLTASDGAMNDLFGTSVAIEGDTIVVGSHLDDVGANADQGSVYTFSRTGVQTGKLTATDGAAEDRFGESVTIGGDTIVIGAPRDDAGVNADQGSVYTFARNGSSGRPETAKLIASDGGANDSFGYSVAIGAAKIVVGSRFNDVDGDESRGSVYTFDRIGAPARSETANLIAADGEANDFLGRSVGISGDSIVAGAPADTVGTNSGQGSAQVFFEPLPVVEPPDTSAPDTTALEGPKEIKRGKKAKFTFESTEPGSSFLCRVDKNDFKPCISPAKVKTKRLKPGKHTFRVYAVDTAGNADATPAKTKFKVKRGKRKPRG